MKKVAVLVIAFTLTITLVACSQKESKSYAGLNAEIIAINSDLKGFTVKSLNDDTILGEKCYVNLESDDVYYIYADNQTGETQDLKYSDFIVGDEITIDTDEVKNKYTLATRIQLTTQRTK